MSEREKKLLNLFAVAGVIILFFWGYTSFTTYKNGLQDQLRKATGDLDEAQMNIASREKTLSEIEWLKEFEPLPRASDEVSGALEKQADSIATQVGLTVKNRKILNTIEAGIDSAPKNYSISQVEFQVTGMEKSLYDWLDQMHVPNQFRVISNLSLTPNKEKEELIDCAVIFDQWFVPDTLNPDAASTASTP